jgi:hypothetical protein
VWCAWLFPSEAHSLASFDVEINAREHREAYSLGFHPKFWREVWPPVFALASYAGRCFAKRLPAAAPREAEGVVRKRCLPLSNLKTSDNVR